MVISDWIKEKVKYNIERDITTSIIVLHNIIPYAFLRSIAWMKPEINHIFIFSENPESIRDFANLRYDSTELGATISEIATKHLKEIAEEK